MLIGFAGSPFSGKTTLAMSLGAYLKEGGYVCDFITEKARNFIRLNKKVGKNYLEYYDQEAIYHSQKNTESDYEELNGKNCINISDGSTINSIYYLSEYFDDNYPDANQFGEDVGRYNYIIFCPIIEEFCNGDNNRFHDLEFSQKMNTYLIEKLKKYDNIIYVNGDNKTRLNNILNNIEGKIGSYHINTNQGNNKQL